MFFTETSSFHDPLAISLPIIKDNIDISFHKGFEGRRALRGDLAPRSVTAFRPDRLHNVSRPRHNSARVSVS